MSSIRIVSTPPGFAPQEIRAQWIGIAIPLPTQEEIDEDPPSGFKVGSENDGGYLVLTKRAVQSLRANGKNEAAEFWDGLPLGRFLEFRRDVCEVIE